MSSVSPREPRLSHDRRILLMAFASALPGRAHLAHLSLDRRLHAQGSVDAHRPHRHVLPRLCPGAARARHPAAPDALEPARRARRRRLLDPRPRRPRRRPPRRSHDRSQRPRRDAPPPATGRARGHDAAEEGDGRDRCRGLHVRRAARVEVRESSGGAPPQPAVRTPPRTEGHGSRPGRLPERRGAAGHHHRVSRRRRPLGNQAQPLPSGRAAARVAGPLRPQSAPARRRAPGVAASDSRHRARDEQLAGADQVDCRQPGNHRRTGSPATRLARRRSAGTRRHRISIRVAQPVHERLRAPGEASASQTRVRSMSPHSSIASRPSRKLITSSSFRGRA